MDAKGDINYLTVSNCSNVKLNLSLQCIVESFLFLRALSKVEQLLVEVHFVVSVEPVEDIQQEGAAQLLFVTVHQ